ncbi:S-layer homology domain-containing protein [Calothrix sp. 336/3]|uniref:S-layer homology domain-containing protein n=1 Tax=Calothrix sp. 336/3 TaxID=1337936 RepID=UPI0004E4186F
MLYQKHPQIYLSLVFVFTLMTGCANSPGAKNLEQSLAADPRLSSNPVVFGTNQITNSPNPQTEVKTQPPPGFPQEIPIYTGAQFQENKLNNGTTNPNISRWLSSDPSNFIATFYRSQFAKNQWQIIQKPSDGDIGTFIAQRQDLQVKVTIQPKTVTGEAIAKPNQSQVTTELLIEYTRNATAQVTPTATPTDSPGDNSPQAGSADFIGPVLPSNLASSPANISTNSDNNILTPSDSQQFSDLNKLIPVIRQYIQDLASLGVLSVNNKADKFNQFEPNKIITRREYARWLVTTNNTLYTSNSAKQIRLVGESSQPAFSDVPRKDPDFAVIQGLAEAGLIPSSLSGDSTEVLFRPDAPLTREQMVLWKIPLDTRQALPTANLEAVKQTWGFQDVGKINPKALRAILADHQNGEQAIIRRVFGYTTLFQPQKPVTRAEAATALWYFGSQGEGISAADALKGKGR